MKLESSKRNEYMMNPRPFSFSGLNVVVSEHAHEMVPIFPDKKRSKRRNRRVRGKYGRLDRMNPVTFKTPHGLVVHPRIYSELKKQAGDLCKG